ncbi:hypothetical protein PMW_15 [Pseudomonas phage phiPMW]|uniref:Uncharacterized protein n=1 Tax=Pseudomonas phage phiPMW TaxID=1815582 RepID=A0A1S5R153_9CAUD|nr:hypothetical protein FDG97_gp015 [Pseudomonas phage phiPMW]ANA49140.1 hypothetical protein PMW_15 [Pseudomonas phage phiPMW]
MSYSIYMNDGREIHDYIETKIAEGIAEVIGNLSLNVEHESASDYGSGYVRVELYMGEDMITSSRASIYER